MFDYGTFLGGMVIGYLGDCTGYRALVILPSLIIATLLMTTMKIGLGDASLPYYFLIFGIGLFQGGPYNNISSVIAIDVCRLPQLVGNK
jgi:OPA family glycerol-3-phosphate transporter-like MFS transporter 3